MKQLTKVRPVYMSCNLELQDEIKPTLKNIIKLFVNEPKELKKPKGDDDCCTEICLIKTPYADVVRTMDSDGQHEFIMFPKDSLDESEWKNHKYNEERVYIEECEGYAP